MHNLLFRRQSSYAPITEIVSPANSDLQFLSLKWLRMDINNREIRFATGDQEAVLDIFSGTVTLHVTRKDGSVTYSQIGHRLHVFDGKPTMVYISCNAQVTILCDSENFEGALVLATAAVEYDPVLIFPSEAESKVVGQDNWQRSVVTSVGDNVSANRLLVGETLNSPGNWSSSPPHKHDQTSGEEAAMEEVYLYKMNPSQGYGLQRVYTPKDDAEPFDVTYAVKDGDVVVLPRGYHPVVAAPGYQLLYLWALAGETRKYGAWTDDPEHSWIKGFR